MKDLDKLTSLSELKYEMSQVELRQLKAEEQRIRGDLTRLSENARSVDGDTKMSMEFIGADVVWQAWVGRMRTELNTQLAQVLAKQERHLARVRKEFSRVQVARELKTKVETEWSKDQSKKELEKAIGASLLKR